MFYSVEDVDAFFKCSFCSNRFEDVVKSIPQCQSSVCGDCHEDLKMTLNLANEFKCLACDDQHVYPREGLPDDFSILKMLQMKPRERKLSGPARKLKSMCHEVQDGLARLQSFDGALEINAKCDKIESSIHLAADSAVRHLKNHQDNLIAQSNSYRSDLLESLKSKETPVLSQDVTQLADEIAPHLEAWHEYFTRLDSDLEFKDMEAELTRAGTFMSTINKKLDETTATILDDRNMFFDEASSFYESADQFGTLRFGMEPASHLGNQIVQIIRFEHS